MLTFIISIGLLIVAYFTYGKFVERFFGASSTIATPVKRLADGWITTSLNLGVFSLSSF